MARLVKIDMAGGQNSATASLFMKDNECEIVQNYNMDNLGSLTKRNGIVYLIGQTVDNMNILNMFYFKNAQGTDYSNILVGVNPTGGATSVIKKIATNAWSNSQTGNTASAIPYFTTFIDYVFRTNGSDVMSSSVDLSSWGTTNCVATVKPKYCWVWEDRVYTGYDNSTTKYPSRIYWSSLPDITTSTITWNATTQYADINPDDNDEITWGEPFGKVSLIFKNKAIYRWTFGQVEADKMPGVQGTPQGLTVKQTQGMCFWANKYGVFALTSPSGTPQLISQKMQPFIDQIPSLANMRAEVDNDHYKLYIGSVTVNNRTYSNAIIVYTLSKKSWHIETYPFAIKAMARMEAITIGTTSLFDDIYLGDDDGFVYRTNSGTVDYLGTTAKPIDGRITTKEYVLPYFPEMTELDKLWFVSQKAKGTKVNYRLNRRDWIAWKDLDERITSSKISGKGETIQFELTDNSRTTSSLEGFVLDSKEKPK